MRHLTSYFLLPIAALALPAPTLLSCESGLPDDWGVRRDSGLEGESDESTSSDDAPTTFVDGGPQPNGTAMDSGEGGSVCGKGTFLRNNRCVAWRNCDPGSYVVEAGSTEADRRCADCPTGTFTATSNEAECQPWSICQPGQYVSQAGTDARNRACEKCRTGTSTTTANAKECVVFAECPPGTLELRNDDEVAVGCETCETGTYCAGGDADIVPCEAGEWDDDGDSSTPCVAHTACEPGTYLKQSGDRLRDQQCAACTDGYFSQDVDASACQQWQDCAAGTYIELGGTASNDVECAGCESGSYSTNTNADSCTSATDCQPGEFVSDPGNATTDRTCSPCPDGQYSATVNAGSCSDPDACPAGTVETAPATGMSAAECAPCSSGSYCAGGTSAEAACAAGTWDDDGDPATPCATKTDCVPGQRIASEGDTTTNRSCSNCDSDNYSTSINALSCDDWTNCSPGTYASVAGSSTSNRECSPCPSGRYSSGSNAASCSPWTTCSAPTFYQSTAPSSTKNRVCTACPSGQISTSDNATSCIVPVYQMSGGQVVMEAEHFHAKTDVATDSWAVEDISAASGGQVMTVGPDAASGGQDWIDYMTVDTSPHFDFNVNFDRTGQFWVFVRGDAAPASPSNGNSCWNFLDNEVFGIPHEFPSTTGTWSWVSSGPLNINSTGLHKVGIYAREDGFRVDKIVIKNSQTAISGAGPAESPQQ